jgi:hypothetical protein
MGYNAEDANIASVIATKLLIKRLVIHARNKSDLL